MPKRRQDGRLYAIFLVTVVVFSLLYALNIGFPGVSFSRARCEGKLRFLRPQYLSILRNYSRFILHAPDLSKSAKLIVLVVIKAEDVHRQQEIRSLWANPENSRVVKEGKAQIIFLTGRAAKPEVESRSESCPLIVDVAEMYENLLQKELVAYKWLAERKVDGYVLKADGKDTVADLDRLFHELELEKPKGIPEIYCSINAGVVAERDPCSEWYVPYLAMASEQFPAYCSGPAYLMSFRALKMILEKADRQVPFIVEDAFFTGMLARAAGIPVVDRSDIFASSGCRVGIYDRLRYFINRRYESEEYPISCHRNGSRTTAIISAHRCKESSLPHLWDRLHQAPCTVLQ